MANRVRAFDLIFTSELVVNGAVPAPEETADAEIVYGTVQDELNQKADGAYAFTSDSILFAPPGVARYRCENHRIVVAPDARADPQLVETHLAANVLPALMWLLGDLVLHGACAGLDGRAIAICGRSGSGKSTLLRSFMKRGADCIADDTIRLSQAAHVMASGLPGMTWQKTETGRVAQPTASHLRLRAAPLSAILFLEHYTSLSSPMFERVHGSEAVKYLLWNMYRIKVPRGLGFMSMVMSSCAQLATHIPLYRWHRPEGVDIMLDEEFTFLKNVSHG